MNNPGSFLLRWWQVFLSWLGFGGDMGVGVKIALGVISGGVVNQNMTVQSTEKQLVNADLSTASEPITVTNLSGSTVQITYEYKG